MFNKERFYENKMEKGIYYAIGFEEGILENICLVIMRAMRYGYDLDEIVRAIECTEAEVEMGRKLYDGIMNIAQGKELICRYFVNHVTPQCGTIVSIDQFHEIAEELVTEIVSKFMKGEKGDAKCRE